MDKKMSFETMCAAEFPVTSNNDSHILPLYLTSSFNFDNIDQGIDIFSSKVFGHSYSRYGNPTSETVAAKLSGLETFGLGIEAKAFMFSSGMSAIASLFLATLQSGDSVLTQGNLYGGTTELLLKVMQPLGINILMKDFRDLNAIEVALSTDKSIRLIYCETPANPTLACVDLAAVTAIAGKYKCLTAIDNTFATPYLQQPFRYGIDFVVHSTTKYLNGHGNSISGVLIGSDLNFMNTKVFQVMKLAGTNSNPFDAWLLHNGLKTLPLRMDRHCENALVIARFLENHPAVVKVNYPGLTSHPDHALASRQMRKYGGMLSFELKGGVEEGILFMNGLRYCKLAPTLGDIDTLILHPASSSHLNVAKEIRLQNGITDGLIRISVGIESVEDLIEDLERGFSQLSR